MIRRLWTAVAPQPFELERSYLAESSVGLGTTDPPGSYVLSVRKSTDRPRIIQKKWMIRNGSSILYYG